MPFYSNAAGLFHAAEPSGTVTFAGTAPIGDKTHSWPKDGFDCFLLRLDQQGHIDAASEYFDQWVACLENPHSNPDECKGYMNAALAEMKLVEEIAELLRACLPQIS